MDLGQRSEGRIRCLDVPYNRYGLKKWIIQIRNRKKFVHMEKDFSFLSTTQWGYNTLGSVRLFACLSVCAPILIFPSGLRAFIDEQTHRWDWFYYFNRWCGNQIDFFTDDGVIDKIEYRNFWFHIGNFPSIPTPKLDEIFNVLTEVSNVHSQVRNVAI